VLFTWEKLEEDAKVISLLLALLRSNSMVMVLRYSTLGVAPKDFKAVDATGAISHSLQD
jgi:hypothetical protein